MLIQDQKFFLMIDFLIDLNVLEFQENYQPEFQLNVINQYVPLNNKTKEKISLFVFCCHGYLKHSKIHDSEQWIFKLSQSSFNQKKKRSMTSFLQQFNNP